MSEHARKHRRHLVPGPLALNDDHSAGEEVLQFTRWFLQSKYKLMGQFLGDLQRTHDAAERERLREYYCRALQHAQYTQRVRGTITVFLALGVLAAAATSIARLLHVAYSSGALDQAAAYSASASVALIAARLAVDRYLERVDIVATFVAIELSASAGSPEAARSRPT